MQASFEVEGLVIDGAVTEHPVLGRVQRIGDTVMTALDWAHPTEIPAIAEPAKLPPGAGGAVMNAIAILAQRAGVPALRYAGPYPTQALWRTVVRSFRTTGTEAAFIADFASRALGAVRTPIPIDFVPSPHERIAIAGGFVERRAAIERVVIDGVAYEPDGSPARLVHIAAPTPDGARPADAAPTPDGSPLAAPAPDGSRPVGSACEVWFGDALYARVATLAADGTLRDGPHPIPPCASAVIGREFPLALRLAIGELVAEAVPAPLAQLARAQLAERSLAWADLGARAARATADGLAVHAALWERIAPLGLGRLALALAEALAPLVTQLAVAAAISK